VIRAAVLLLLFSGCTEWEPMKSIPGASLRRISGDPATAGPFRYQLEMPSGARIESHRHSTDMHVKVLRGSMFITMSGETRHFTGGSEFTIPADTWHLEWWDELSIMEASGVGPMKSEFATARASRPPLRTGFQPKI
jgi:hypothetical protein